MNGKENIKKAFHILDKKIFILLNFTEENLYFAKILRVKKSVYTDKISMSGSSAKPSRFEYPQLAMHSLLDITIPSMQDLISVHSLLRIIY